MASWAAEEMASVKLGDVRLNRRLITLLEQLAEQPRASLPVAVQERAAIEAAFRFLRNERVRPAAIRAAHRRATRQRALAEGAVLVIQDTTSLDFTSHKALDGVGMLDHPQCRGVFVHTSLAVSVDGLPLGVVAQEMSSRDPATRGIGAQRNSRPVEEKESQRWLTALAATRQALWGDLVTITIADREAEFYALWTAPRREQDHLLLRARHDRETLDPGGSPLWATLAAAPTVAEETILVPRHHEGAHTTPAREARVVLRTAPVTLAPPTLFPAGAPLRLQGLRITEVDPPADVEPIDWVLLTTLPQPDAALAVQYLRWYTYRWLIERFHYVLKSGCGIEETQVRTTERVERVLALYTIVAWRLLSLLLTARAAPAVSCETVLTPLEWQVAWVVTQAGAPLPATAPSLQEALRLIARLGGFRGRASDGDPGIKALWRGWARVSDMIQGYRANQQLGARVMATA